MIPYMTVLLAQNLIPVSIAMFLMVLSNVNSYALRHPKMKQGILALFKCKQMPNTLNAWEANRLDKG